MNIKRYERGFSEDHRGSVEFFNELNLSEYKSFYTVTNPKIGTVRAWHGHKNEKKLIKVLSGKFLVGLIKIDDWENPDKTVSPEMVEMDINSDLLSIPEGYANGAMNLEENSKIMLIDDLLAKGAPASTAGILIKEAGGCLIGYAFLVELTNLMGRKNLDQNVTIESVLKY